MSFIILKFTGHHVASTPQLLDEVISLDKLNMESIMKASNYNNFSWERRITGLQGETTQFFGAYKDRQLIGYLELCRDHSNPHDIYLSSIQIQPSYQGSSLFKALLKHAFTWLKQENFNILTSNVQISNSRMLKIFKQLNFEIIDRGSNHTRAVRGDFQLITQSKLFLNLVK